MELIIRECTLYNMRISYSVTLDRAHIQVQNWTILRSLNQVSFNIRWRLKLNSILLWIVLTWTVCSKYYRKWVLINENVTTMNAVQTLHRAVTIVFYKNLIATEAYVRSVLLYCWHLIGILCYWPWTVTYTQP